MTSGASGGRGTGDLVVFHPVYADLFADSLGAAASGRRWPGRVLMCRDAAAVAAAAPGAEAVCATGVGFPLAELQRAPRLAWVHNLGAGVDWLLAPPGVPAQAAITRSRGLHGETMAEFVIGHLLALAVDVPRGLGLKAAHAWERYPVRRLSGARLGVAGLGAIGRKVARLAHALGMDVWGLARAARPCRYASRVFAPEELSAFLAGLDYLVIVLPLTPATRGMFGAAEFARMKSTAAVANIGRGAAVDEAALIDALRRGAIAGAALDVFATEPLPPESPLWDMPNVLITPHMAGRMDPARACDFFSENVGRYLAGRPLLGLVSRRRGY